jgi:hypothetical protein
MRADVFTTAAEVQYISSESEGERAERESTYAPPVILKAESSTYNSPPHTPPPSDLLEHQQDFITQLMTSRKRKEQLAVIPTGDNSRIIHSNDWCATMLAVPPPHAVRQSATQGFTPTMYQQQIGAVYLGNIVRNLAKYVSLSLSL